jgi:hypothetical protein
MYSVFTLTIYFIVLNVSVEFVLIYRPHPVHKIYYKKYETKLYPTGQVGSRRVKRTQQFVEMKGRGRDGGGG